MSSPSLSSSVLEGFAQATRDAAIATLDLIGSGDKHEVDRVAVVAMRDALSRLAVDGLVLVGEGEKDEAPMLHIGERFGSGDGPAVDIAVDPVDGTTTRCREPSGCRCRDRRRCAWQPLRHRTGALHGKTRDGCFGPVDWTWPTPWGRTSRGSRQARGTAVSDLVVAVQDRPRNAGFVAEIAAAGARVDLFADGDVERCLLAAQPDTEIDMLVGIGGAPEGILTAAAVRALGGQMQGRLAPQRRREADSIRRAGLDTGRILTLAELCSGDAWLFLTAITDCRLEAGSILPGVQLDGDEVVARSWSVGPGITVRGIETRTPR